MLNKEFEICYDCTSTLEKTFMAAKIWKEGNYKCAVCVSANPRHLMTTHYISIRYGLIS